ncbi:MAG: hypothetical protein GY696_22875 [Gammaproteobacteria bacterium]|nr:hypothetical protein [Gammaproteobacteria bacterium]
MSSRSAQCNQGASVILNKDAGGQPSVLPPAAVGPCAKVQAPPPPLGGKGLCQPPPLPPEGEDECKGGGEKAQEDMIREKKEGGTQMPVTQDLILISTSRRASTLGETTHRAG